MNRQVSVVSCNHCIKVIVFCWGWDLFYQCVFEFIIIVLWHFLANAKVGARDVFVFEGVVWEKRQCGDMVSSFIVSHVVSLDRVE